MLINEQIKILIKKEWDICIVSKYFLTKYLLISRGNPHHGEGL